MTKRVKRKKKKIRMSRVFLVLFLFALVSFLIYIFIKVPVRGYYISGNNYYTDQEILEKTKLDKYPSYLLTTSFSVNQKVKRDPLIKNIEIKKTLTGMFNVVVEENKILFYDSSKSQSILENTKTISYYDELSPVLVNEITDKDVYKKFINRFNKINDSVLKNVSEIKYEPNDLDKERFLFSMNDGNCVYLTLSKITNINNYLEISNTLGGRNGILYLDYGNYFVPKE